MPTIQELAIRVTGRIKQNALHFVWGRAGQIEEAKLPSL